MKRFIVLLILSTATQCVVDLASFLNIQGHATPSAEWTTNTGQLKGDTEHSKKPKYRTPQCCGSKDFVLINISNVLVVLSTIMHCKNTTVNELSGSSTDSSMAYQNVDSVRLLWSAPTQDESGSSVRYYTTEMCTISDGRKVWRKLDTTNQQFVAFSFVPPDRQLFLKTRPPTSPGSLIIQKGNNWLSIQQWSDELPRTGHLLKRDERKAVGRNLPDHCESPYSSLVETLDRYEPRLLYYPFGDARYKQDNFLMLNDTISAYRTPETNWYMTGNEIDKSQSDLCVHMGMPKFWPSMRTDSMAKAPRFHMPLANLREVPEGAEMILTCVVIGIPTPDITWLMNDKRLTALEGRATRCDDGVCTLVIPSTTVNDAGTYTCVATNAYGTVRSTTIVIITPAHENDFCAPMFIDLLANRCVLEHDEIVLECYVIGKPTPSITWYKDGLKLMVENRMLQYTDRKGFTSLNIMKAVQRDTGEYTCVANNIFGKDFTHSRVEVIASVDFGRFLLSSQFFPSCKLMRLPTLNLNKPRAPVITRPLVDTVVNTGCRELFELEVDGLPTPTTEWYHDGKLVAESRTLRTYFDGRVAFLKIFEAQHDHQGQYVCKVTNKFGSVESSAMLFVDRESVEHASKMPVFLEKIKDVVVEQLGASASFSCSVRGNPPPKVWWLHNGCAIHNNPSVRTHITRNGIARLDINVTTYQLCGTYTAVATNEFGDAYSSAVLRLQLHKDKNKFAHYASTLPDTDPGIPAGPSTLTSSTTSEGDQ